ncbi:hypothetical protein NUSPORA_00024 [Nucleospora cyclopteri]
MPFLLNLLNKIPLNKNNTGILSVTAKETILIYENISVQDKTVAILNSNSGMLGIAAVGLHCSYCSYFNWQINEILKSNAKKYNIDLILIDNNFKNDQFFDFCIIEPSMQKTVNYDNYLKISSNLSQNTILIIKSNIADQKYTNTGNLLGEVFIHELGSSHYSKNTSKAIKYDIIHIPH